MLVLTSRRRLNTRTLCKVNQEPLDTRFMSQKTSMTKKCLIILKSSMNLKNQQW